MSRSNYFWYAVLHFVFNKDRRSSTGLVTETCNVKNTFDETVYIPHRPCVWQIWFMYFIVLKLVFRYLLTTSTYTYIWNLELIGWKLNNTFFLSRRNLKQIYWKLEIYTYTRFSYEKQYIRILKMTSVYNWNFNCVFNCSKYMKNFPILFQV